MYLDKRKALISSDVKPSVENRLALTQATDEWLISLAEAAGCKNHKIALVAVGGYGRKELCAGSDLDVLLLHHQSEKPELIAKVAESIWYPIWDSGISLDHSVRDVAQVRRMATADFKVVLGLLDARVIYGDEELFSEARTSVLSDWRTMSKERLQQLRQSSIEREQRFGNLAHLLEPDLKESYGGLREVTILRAIAASWVTDISRARVDEAHQTLLNVRDGLHRITKRSTDKLTMHEQAEVAKLLEVESDDELLRTVSLAARTLAYESEVAWARVEKATTKKSIFPLKKIQKEFRLPLADGVVVQDGEVVLARDVQISTDPGLCWRVAAAASQHGLQISAPTLNLMQKEIRELPNPWPRETLNSLVSFLGSGPHMVNVWEALDQYDLINRMLPKWSPMQALPQRNALHIYTVDRHSIECVVRASSLSRMVARPDLLLIAALYHDIGKPHKGDHSVVGAQIMTEVCAELGFSDEDSKTLESLIRHHLLLAETATRRDVEDLATIDLVAEKVSDVETLELLHNLTIADSQATSDQNWSSWKASLIQELVGRVSAKFGGKHLPTQLGLSQQFPFAPSLDAQIKVTNSDSQSDIYISTADRIGLVADVAGALRVLRLDIKFARFETVDGIALQQWQVIPLFGEAADVKKIELEILLALTNPQSISSRLEKFSNQKRPRGYVPAKPVVRFVKDASEKADVFEVRAHDESALLHRIAQIVAFEKLEINSARIDTMGSEVVDVLYLTNSSGQKLSDLEKSELIFKVEAELRNSSNL